MVYVRTFAVLSLVILVYSVGAQHSFAAVSHTASGWGSASPDQFRALAPPNSKIQSPFIEIYKNRATDPQTFRQARFERSQDFLAKKVAADFKNALGGKDDWAIIAAEGVNTSPLLGGKGKTESHLFSARAFAELLGSMPGTEEDPLLARITKKKQQFEAEMNALERKKETEELSAKDQTALEYAKLGYWAAEEAEKILKEGEQYQEAEGKGDMVAFKKDFAKEFSDKIERVRDFDELVDRAADGDKKARQTLIDSFAALPTYFTTQSPERANKAVRAVGEGPDNLIKLYDQNGKEFPVKFGSTDAEIQNTIAQWADRYRNGDFELKPPIGTTPGGRPAGAPEAAQSQLAELQQRQAEQALQKTLAQAQASGQPLSPQAIAAAQQKLQQAQQQFLASRNAQEQQLAFRKAQDAIRGTILARGAVQQPQLASAQPFNLTALYQQLGYPFGGKTGKSGGGNFSQRDESLDSVAEEVANDGRCTSCHGAKSAEEVFDLVQDGGTMPDGTSLESVLDTAEVDDLKKWAQAQ